jgi:hypothetical protein
LGLNLSSVFTIWLDRVRVRARVRVRVRARVRARVRVRVRVRFRLSLRETHMLSDRVIDRDHT